jgi:pectate lyase
LKHNFYFFVCLFTFLGVCIAVESSAADRRKPLISNVRAGSITASSAAISWTTNEVSNSQVQYGLTTSYGSSTSVHPTKLKNHQLGLSGLSPDRIYHYRVKSQDAAGNLAISNDYTFRTATSGSTVSSVPPKAFPGATGFGTGTPGGRGGAILKVTNLNNSGAGSLRAAVEAYGKRTVIFEVSGTIFLTSELKLLNPYITIAGQTAPSPGITLRGAEFRIKSNNVIVQHIRVRVGDAVPSGVDPASVDSISVEGPAYNVVIDHVSVSWGIDENLSLWYDGIHDVTISNCIISEALNLSSHPSGAHSMGLMTTPNGRNIAILRNLMAHNSDRNPLISNGGSVVLSNNVFYNWTGGRATNIGNTSSSNPARYATLVSDVGNVYIGGLDTTSSTYAISDNTSLNSGSKIYYSDARVTKVAGIFRHQASFSTVVSTPPIWISGFVALPSSYVESAVRGAAGSRPADRDAVDLRIVSHLANRNGRIINRPSDVGGWPTLAVNRRTINVPSNANADDDGDGYTNFEESVLFPMAAQVEGR